MDAPVTPTQSGALDLRYDFNDGARVLLPAGEWRVELHDTVTGNLLFAADSPQGWVLSAKKFYVSFQIKVWRRGEPEPCLDHRLNLADQPVLVSFPIGTLGDVLAWFPYLERFQQRHGCQLYYSMAANIAPLFKDSYPQLRYLDPADPIPEFYATYRLGLFFDDHEHIHQPIDFRLAGLHRTAGEILGVDSGELRPRIPIQGPRSIAEPYVCIAVQASTQCKKWNNPSGWSETINHLKNAGYRVLCIDQTALHGQVPAWTYRPPEAEDFTGDRPLLERAALLQHASAFIGVSSGLAWLAWACHIPVLMISGFTLPFNEFHTPHRIFNVHTCNGCWNDVRHRFDHQDFFWCPRHKGTARQYECSSLITARQVIDQLDLALTPPPYRSAEHVH
ncbi:autotransporter strand-loop-strand O-heptosyltransferase [Pseudomonas peli]|uniref:autotransporter strand-loop-strand O-heptosyltransferase n=1 Tax=Pseudomonas peli TaxID=592361 RepID=UPI0024AD8B74|nr:autotransporter strand-loop-strand O-heptosyltransferase [Pseudomonas peli]